MGTRCPVLGDGAKTGWDHEEALHWGVQAVFISKGCVNSLQRGKNTGANKSQGFSKREGDSLRGAWRTPGRGGPCKTCPSGGVGREEERIPGRAGGRGNSPSKALEARDRSAFSR